MLLNRATLETALAALDAELGLAGHRATLHIVGGAVLCLVLRARESTKDVDAWFTDAAAVRAAAKKVAATLDLPEDWLNDAAKAFVPEGAKFESWRSYENLDILVADDRTLFAMKCAAARSQEDAEDIRLLAQRLGLGSSGAALAVVLDYYPPDRLPSRTRLLLEEMLDDSE